MAVKSSTLCILVLTLVLGATLFGSCMANKEVTTKHWGWGRGWRWGRGRGQGQGQGRVWSSGRDRGGSRGWRHHSPLVSPPSAGCPSSHSNITSGGSNKIVVGGSNKWNFGFNYSDWALKNGPFYLNDVLVFKYDAPVNNNTAGHSVYLLPDFWSYLKCDLSRAKRVATTTQGGGKGFEFKLTNWQPHYFACGEHNGIHCNLGMMKFFVMPIFRYSN